MRDNVRARLRLQQFADDYALHLVERGKVGFERPCVGLCYLNADNEPDSYVAYNPVRRASYPDQFIDGLYDERLAPDPQRVPDAYPKFRCLAVRAYPQHENDAQAYDNALIQLYRWIIDIEARLRDDEILYVVTYATGAEGLQALLTGVTSQALIVTTPAQVARLGDIGISHGKG